MQGYYYTICSLPHLCLTTSALPIHSPAFLRLCALELCQQDMDTIETVTLLPTGETTSPLPAIERWYNKERLLRLELARQRAIQLGRDDFGPQEAVPSPFFAKIVQEAMTHNSPLEAENLLYLSRWRLLTELGAGNHFNLTRLALYFLKLQLLEHRALFNQGAGQRLRREITQKITLTKRPST